MVVAVQAPDCRSRPLTAVDVPQTASVRLAGGELRVAVDRSDLPLDALCGFASRRNPKRPFLFVSRVLGRHLPVRPKTMRMVHRMLAARLPAGLPGPAVVVGMAETAVALGHGVHDAWRVMSKRDDLLFIHSTRYHLAGHRLLSTFEESHSHATGHLIHQPAAPADADLFAACRTLVLVDDEASTGSTFVALAEACRSHMPGLSRIVCVTITDWMGEGRRLEIRSAMPARTDFVSLLEGSYSFRPSDTPPPKVPDVTGDGGAKDALVPVNWGRTGLRAPRPLPTQSADSWGGGSGDVYVPMTAKVLEDGSVLIEDLDRNPMPEEMRAVALRRNGPAIVDMLERGRTT